MSITPRAAAALLENAPCGFATANLRGEIDYANSEFYRLVQRVASPDEQLTLPGVLSLGGRIYLETHLLPRLELEGSVREAALDVLRPDGTRQPVLLNADLDRDAGVMHVVLSEAGHRRQFEEALLVAMRTADTARHDATRLAQTLQQTLIPPTPPAVPHLDLAAGYRPAGTGDEVGGDFYDVVQTGPDTWCVVLGDVSGKGVEAALVTSFVRYAVRSLAIEHPDPAELLGVLDTALKADPTERHCTLALARLRRADGAWTMSLALAGHPAPLARGVDGSVVELGITGPPVGLVDDPAFHTTTTVLGDETVTFFTDGITEARGADDLFGDDRLHELIAALPHEVGAITDGVIEAALDYQQGRAADDIAVLTLRSTHLGPPSAQRHPRAALAAAPGGPDAVHPVDLDLEAVSRTRRRLARDLLEAGCADPLVRDAEAVLSELLMNAVIHGVPDASGRVWAAWTIAPHTVVLSVRDEGGTSLPHRTVPGEDDGGGRGLLLVEALSESWNVDVDGRTVVTATLRREPSELPAAPR